MLQLLGVHRRVGLLQAARVSLAPGRARASRSRSSQQDDEEPRLLPWSGFSDQVGVKREATGSCRAAARGPVSVAHGWPCCPRPLRAVRDVRARLDHRGVCRALSGIGGLSPPRRSAGHSHASDITGAQAWRGAHSSGGITPGCTRRRRANIVHIQATATAGVATTHWTLGSCQRRLHFRHQRASDSAVGGAVDRGLSGRAAPLVNRSRWAD